ncbi:hypothetical protein [Aquimarina sp. 2201CG5-10]|uniref:hypothetical protein n=1 Tax=Aquimarina callyspongiae TaxID=3098150 RepID=UPI002AB43798|nr:hypothetical protein [Aquimarina sp. 2201CG5-10]MDY8137611.1 hypothetical protein [Aquimarina sp. 2201CG5-10]
MNRDKEISKVKKSKYFPEEYLEDFSDDLDILIEHQEQEKQKLINEIGNENVKVDSKKFFDSMTFAQKGYLYRLDHC